MHLHYTPTLQRETSDSLHSILIYEICTAPLLYREIVVVAYQVAWHACRHGRAARAARREQGGTHVAYGSSSTPLLRASAQRRLVGLCGCMALGESFLLLPCGVGWGVDYTVV